ncbi:HAD family hydrolase [Lentibacillus salicampi]|uniref:HAD family hydrolase n=1 Tax=Lentibacillus salicampi TaxID=175306 RepID=A0A4Y9AC96_9BACI|nr:HAD-IA family hydrolase [Lentibacillus salicampi]TFJ92014.1 HAD family hydrolase [Lentibacillus salicampi]
MAKCTINQQQTYNIDGILFDKDGTLIEFSSLWVIWAEQLIAAIMSKAKLPEKDRDILSDAIGFLDSQRAWDPTGPLCIGSLDELKTICALHLYKRGLPWNAALEMVTNAHAEMEQQNDWKESIKPVTGLANLLRQADTHSVKLGVVTSDNHEQALSHLQALEVKSYFCSVIGHDQVKHGKPFPDMVYKACMELGIHPERALIIGDSNGDMILGKKGNTVASIGIVAESNQTADHLIDADHIIRTYDSITIAK